MKKHITPILASLLTVLMLLTLTSCMSTDPANDIKDIVGNQIDNDADNDGGNDGNHTEPDESFNSDTTDDNGEENKANEDKTSDVTEEVTISEKVCFDYNGFVVTAKKLVNDFWGTGIKLLIENNTDEDYSVGVEQVIVNNCMTNSFFSCAVASGKKANDTLYLSSEDLKAAEIDNIGQIEIYFYVYDSSSYETVYETDSVTIVTSAFEQMDIKAADAGYPLYNKGGIKIVGKYVDEDTFWGTSVLLYIENSSDRNITVSCDDMSINGYMVNGYLYETIYQGKYAIADITVFSSELEENDIESVDEVELKFCINDADTYKTIAETDAIGFRTKQ